MYNNVGKSACIVFLAALAVIGTMAAFIALSPVLRSDAQVEAQEPRPTRTPKPPICKLVLATTSGNPGRYSDNPMRFAGTVNTSDFRPDVIGRDGIFDLSNLYGKADCHWTARTNMDWITMRQTSGTIPAGREQADMEFTINDNARTRPRGSHRGRIDFSVSSGEIKGSSTLYIELLVLEPCRFEAEDTYLHFTMKQGQDPRSLEPQRITVRNLINSGDCRWELDHDARWLSVEPRSGKLRGGESDVLEAQVSDGASTLPARDGHGVNIRFLGGLINDLVGGQLDIEPPPCELRLERTRPEFNMAGPMGGPFEPDIINLRLTNVGGEVCNWHTTPGEWLNITPASGVLPPEAGAPVEIAVKNSAGAKTPGQYSETMTFNAGESGGDNSITINLDVAPLPCQLSAGAVDRLEFKRLITGDFTPSKTVEIANSPHRKSCDWKASGPEWLTITPESGTLASGTKEIVKVAVAGDNTNSLAPQRTYDGIVQFIGPSEGADSPTIGTSLELQCLDGLPCVGLHSNRKEIVYPEEAELTLTMSTPLARPELTVSLFLEIPAGWSLEPGDFGSNCSGGHCNDSYRIPPGDTSEISIVAAPSEPSSELREYEFTGRVEYFYGNRSDAQSYEIAIPITVKAASEETIWRRQQEIQRASVTATPPPTLAPTATPADIAPPENDTQDDEIPQWASLLIVLMALILVVILLIMVVGAVFLLWRLLRRGRNRPTLVPPRGPEPTNPA